jgi:glycosyltransferase involved in cell wall biosynthesis
MDKSEKLTVSIITVCYNSSKTILDTINSVNSQSYPEIEHIFVDGLSSDNTVEIINLNSQTKNVVISEKDNGLYDAINKGISIATGDVIGFLHSDDLLASSSIILDLMTEMKSKKLDGIYGDLEYVDKYDTNKIIRYWKSCEFRSVILKQGWMPAHPTLFLKKQVYDKHGVFNTSYKIAADYDFMLRILKDNNLNYGYLPKVITKMRVGGASNRSLKNIIQKTREDYRAITSNNIGGWLSILLKNLSKIKQFRIN